jgi:ATP-dependent RNA helicase RhlE
MTSFSDLGLIGPLLKALDAEGYSQPTPIQARAIPSLLAGRDLLGIAQTGTGKTAAFALPIIQRLLADPKPAPRKGSRVLILSPTRELARQIGDSFRTYGKFTKLSVAVVFGGMPSGPQARQLMNGVDVLVATPGRLLDHINTRAIDIRATEIFVLDEADQMLDLGFIVPIRRLVKQLPHKRQNLFFSATMPGEIGKLASELLHEPEHVAVAPVATTAERVEQQIIFVETEKKRALLIDLLRDEALSRVLVFVRTKHGADKVGQSLAAAGLVGSVIHGNKSQGQRMRALESFRRGEARVLVATDIAARGIDIDGVTHVINFDLPEVPESYVHRIGRTARAGAGGKAVAFCSNAERNLLRQIEKLTRLQIPQTDRRADPSVVADALPKEHRRKDQRPQDHRRGHAAQKAERPHHEHRKGNPHQAQQSKGKPGGKPGGSNGSKQQPPKHQAGRPNWAKPKAGRPASAPRAARAR